jgi:hypothetical protein
MRRLKAGWVTQRSDAAREKFPTRMRAPKSSSHAISIVQAHRYALPSFKETALCNAGAAEPQVARAGVSANLFGNGSNDQVDAERVGRIWNFGRKLVTPTGIEPVFQP